MTVKTLELSIGEAKRFLKAAQAALATRVKTGEYEYLPNGKINATVKRSSMDLTRSLADLQKPT